MLKKGAIPPYLNRDRAYTVLTAGFLIKYHYMLSLQEANNSNTVIINFQVTSVASIDTMELPKTQKKWVISGTTKEIDEWQLVDGPVPTIDSYSVLVKMHAAAINFRDLMIARVCLIFHHDEIATDACAASNSALAFLLTVAASSPGL